MDTSESLPVRIRQSSFASILIPENAGSGENVEMARDATDSAL